MKIKIITMLAAAMMVCQCISSAQKIDYLGQEPPGTISGIFAKGIVSTSENEHSAPDFSPNSKTTNLVPPLRAHHALVYDEKNQSIFMTAGSTPIDGGNDFVFYNDLWEFKNGAWSDQGTAGDKRSGIRLAYDSRRQKIYSFGGYADNRSLNDLRVFENGNWNTVSILPEMKAAEPGFVYDAHRDRLIVFGGSSEMGKVNSDTWEWDGQAWKKFEGPGPEGRQAFAMIYDKKRKKTVLFGGMGTSPKQQFADTWEYDGQKWKLINIPSPGVLQAMGFTYDSKRGEMLIFGGIGPEGQSGNTWVYHKSTWKKRAETGPTPRVMGHMAYDVKRDQVILFGGRINWPTDVNDTWIWDGKVWTELH